MSGCPGAQQAPRVTMEESCHLLVTAVLQDATKCLPRWKEKVTFPTVIAVQENARDRQGIEN